ncbi:hypothetical protein [Acaryochloris thomasi]|nr:hypothetical protein [Acaryochloris thomasi]
MASTGAIGQWGGKINPSLAEGQKAGFSDSELLHFNHLGGIIDRIDLSC